MNVTLNLPVDAGAGRADAGARRTHGADTEGHFRALIDQAATAERGSRSDTGAGAANAPDDGESEVSPRRHGSDPAVQGAAQEATGENESASDTPARADGKADRHARRHKDTAAVDRQDAGQANRVHDGKATTVDSGTVALENATVAVARTDHPAPSDQAKAATGSGNTTPASDGPALPPDGVRQGVAAKPAAATDADSGRVRFWARGDSQAAFAASADGGRRQPAGSTATMPQGDGQAGPVRGADGPIDVRVTAYERHLAPATRRDKRGGPADGGAAKSGAAPSMPAIDGAVQVEAASPEGPRPPPKSGTGLAAEDDNGSSATAKAPSERQAAGRQDQIAVPDPAKPSEHDQPQGRDNRAAGQSVAASSRHTEPKPPAAAGVTPATGTATANPSAPAVAPVPASPLVAGVASGIAGALAPARATLRGPDGAAGANAATEPVRTIALNLDMREYGQIDLRISLRGNVVSIHFKADRQETAQALARDDAALRALLHRSGYEAQQIQVDRRDATTTRFGDASSSGQQQTGGAGSGASSGHTAGGEHSATPDERPLARREAGAFVLHDQDTHDAPRQDRYRGADRLYV